MPLGRGGQRTGHQRGKRSSERQAFVRSLGQDSDRHQGPVRASSSTCSLIPLPHGCGADARGRVFATRQDIDAGNEARLWTSDGSASALRLHRPSMCCTPSATRCTRSFKRPEYAPPPLLKRMLVTGPGSGASPAAASTSTTTVPRERPSVRSRRSCDVGRSARSHTRFRSSSRSFRSTIAQIVRNASLPRRAPARSTLDAEYAWDVRELFRGPRPCFALAFDERYGGTGTGHLMQAIAIEEVAKGCAASALNARGCTTSVPCRSGSPARRR